MAVRHLVQLTDSWVGAGTEIEELNERTPLEVEGETVNAVQLLGAVAGEEARVFNKRRLIHWRVAATGRSR